jgi:hypothetical protein
MELGAPKRIYTVEPIVLPVPEPAPPANEADEVDEAERPSRVAEAGSKR